MTRKPSRPSPDGYGSIHDHEVLPVREAARRLGWGAKTTRAAQEDGLRTVLYGRMRYTTGRWIREFIEELAERQNRHA
jgi:hypothetical protein